MRAYSVEPAFDEVYSPDEIARAAGVAPERVRDLVRAGHAIAFRNFISQTDAIRLVRLLAGAAPVGGASRSPLTLPPETKRRGVVSLLASGALHAAFLGVLALIAWMGLLSSSDTEQVVKDETPTRLVFLMSAGPGGGGGGGGLQIPTPPPPAEKKAPVKLPKVSSPVPPARKPPPQPPVVTPPPPRVDPPKPVPVIQAPVVSVPADPIEKAGIVQQVPASPAINGPGTNGGVGTGTGVGLGEGQGSGIGPGSGGGTGGGPYQPGSGIEPPSLLREVKPLYTEEARRRSVEGDVVLEIVVRRDGSVGDVHVLHTLGAGLEQKAIDAVRQWRFGPARRQGSPVDVIVEVSVGFKLR